jgi:hypothetical protein
MYNLRNRSENKILLPHRNKKRKSDDNITSHEFWKHLFLSSGKLILHLKKETDSLRNVVWCYIERKWGKVQIIVTDNNYINVLLTVHHSISVELNQRYALLIQFIKS